MGLQGIYRGMERFTWVYKDIQGFTEVIQGINYRVIQGIYRGMERFTWVYKDIQGFTEVIQGYTRVYTLQGITVTREYRRIQRNAREYKRIQENTREYKRIQENTEEYIREYKEIQRNALGIQVNTGKEKIPIDTL